MNNRQEYTTLEMWLQRGIERLLTQGWNIERFFDRMWQRRAIHYNGDHFDIVDEFSARLVCSSIYTRRQFLIVLPDKEPRRPAALLASALVMSGMQAIKKQAISKNVLYFGTRIGIRSQLSHVSIGNLKLSDVFHQTAGRGEASVCSQPGERLQNVICVYSPLDPVALVKKHRPSWVAIDCDDEPTIRWLPTLLKYLKCEGIPTVAWSCNPLSQIVDVFEKVGLPVFTWPFASTDLLPRKVNTAEACKFVVRPTDPAMIVPCIINGDTSKTLSLHLGGAYRALSIATTKMSERLSHDAIMTGWRYLRRLERLIAPIDLFDAEAGNYWGITPVNQLRRTYDKFVDVIQTRATVRDIRDLLEIARNHLDSAYQALQDRDPPRWDTLIDICLEDRSSERVKVLVFPSIADKSIFSFALLARMNTSEKDLAEMRIWLLPFRMAETAIEKRVLNAPEDKEWKREEENDNAPPLHVEWDVVLVAPPNADQSRRMGLFLKTTKPEILLYPYQLPALSRVVSWWGERLGTNPRKAAESLSVLANANLPESIPSGNCGVHMCAPRIVASKAHPKEIYEQIKPLWEPLSEIDEIQSLLVEDEIDSSLPEGMSLEGEIDEAGSQASIVDNAVKIVFSDNWYGLFAPDAKVNAVHNVDGNIRITKRYVKSLRVGDKVIYISGQKRQSLYDLVISRVHRHPSIEIHMTLIHQWQAEIQRAYVEWRGKGKTLDDLLREMKERGSSIESDVTLRFWVSGCTLRPRDREDLRRIAEIIGMTFTLRHYRRIHSAGDRIHALHIALSRRLNSWIQYGASKADDDLLDEATGLTFSDVRDSLILLQVKSVSNVSGPFDRCKLGWIERGTTSE